MSDSLTEWKRRVLESPLLCLAYVMANAEEGNPQSAVDAIDAFAKTRGMMNVGDVKGAIVDEQIRARKPLVMAELGGYSGYSVVRFASVQREVAGSDSHYYSFEYSPEYAEIVKEVRNLIPDGVMPWSDGGLYWRDIVLGSEFRG